MHHTNPPEDWLKTENTKLREAHSSEITENQDHGSRWAAVQLMYKGDKVLEDSSNENREEIAQVFYDAAERLIQIQASSCPPPAERLANPELTNHLPKFEERRAQYTSLTQRYSDIRLTIEERDGKSVIEAPNPLLFEPQAVDLRRYYQSEILHNVYKSLKWSVVALLLTADVIRTNRRYSQRQALAYPYHKLAEDTLHTIKECKNDQDGTTEADIRDRNRLIDKKVKAMLGVFWTTQGLLPVHGKRPMYSKSDLNDIFELEQTAIDWELEEGILTIEDSKLQNELCKRVLNRTGYDTATIRKYHQQWKDRKQEEVAKNNNIIMENKQLAVEHEQEMETVIRDDFGRNN